MDYSQIALIALAILLVGAGATRAARKGSPPRSRSATKAPSRHRAFGGTPDAYPGDFTGTVKAEYAPKRDGKPDPGEIVWTWVPFEEDHSRGKDRPVLIVGRDSQWLLALQLTSKDHDRDAADEARHGRRWIDIGTGPWDRQGRPSEVRLDRVLRISADNLRREGATLGRDKFEQVARSL